jgi:5-formyltetrahydrofolate cyclo-ligase
MRQNSGQPTKPSKQVLRRELRSGRNSLSDPLRVSYDEAITGHLLKLVKSIGANSIACYWPFNGEPDITPAYRQLLADGCQLALPVISDDDQNDMNFYSWCLQSTVTRNRYGIFEPQDTGRVALSSLDMLIIPLVGYDRLGNRLGMGAGYYDRHLVSLRDLQLPLRVGIAYSLQEIDLVDTDSWDVPLHGVVNERGWFTFEETEPLAHSPED